MRLTCSRAAVVWALQRRLGGKAECLPGSTAFGPSRQRYHGHAHPFIKRHSARQVLRRAQLCVWGEGERLNRPGARATRVLVLLRGSVRLVAPGGRPAAAGPGALLCAWPVLLAADQLSALVAATVVLAYAIPFEALQARLRLAAHVAASGAPHMHFQARGRCCSHLRHVSCPGRRRAAGMPCPALG